jgi:hypothetical protein
MDTNDIVNNRMQTKDKRMRLNDASAYQQNAVRRTVSGANSTKGSEAPAVFYMEGMDDSIQSTGRNTVDRSGLSKHGASSISS